MPFSFSPFRFKLDVLKTAATAMLSHALQLNMPLPWRFGTSWLGEQETRWTTIKPERSPEPFAETRWAGGKGLTLMIPHPDTLW